MPKKPPKDVTVTVKLHPPGSAEPFHFVQQELPTNGDNVLVFENSDKTYGFRIHYVLDDSENPGYRFPQRQTGGAQQIRQQTAGRVALAERWGLDSPAVRLTEALTVA